ncbi:MAG TPA: ATP-binding protein, partial [Thermoanaerobaculia bacterium]|nr:ATP-binding protein [Thermoanaerobaculia bacterium]
AKRAAEEANDAKDRFLAALSHELRTPLTPILTVSASLEEDRGLPEEVRTGLAMIRRNAELEARLIDDLLDLTRVAHGKLELHPEVTDLREVIEHAVETCCGRETASGRIELKLELEAGEHRVWGDTSRLTQVFWNLLNNAVKFTPTGGTITVATHEEAGLRPELVVEVTDTGIGIAPEILPRIFEAFEQGDRRITRQFGGLGLGLAVSRAILELHGGRIETFSEGIGHGATFVIHLPAGLPAEIAEADRPAAAAPAPEPAAGERVAPLHILLVEDHPDTAEAMAELLRGFGHQVTAAATVAGALAATAAAEAAHDGIDLVVSDLGLPDGSGQDLMRELVRRYGLRGIALSGYGMEDDIRKSLEAGFGRHLTKPVNPQILKSAIAQAAQSAPIA